MDSEHGTPSVVFGLRYVVRRVGHVPHGHKDFVGLVGPLAAVTPTNYPGRFWSWLVLLALRPTL